MTYPENKKPSYWLAFRRYVFTIFLNMGKVGRYSLPEVMGKKEKKVSKQSYLGNLSYKATEDDLGDLL